MKKLNQKSNNGFSMVEMMIIIALVAIITGIGIATWDRYITNSNLREAARAIEADMKFMQRNARANAFTVTDVYFDTATTVDADYKIIFNKNNNEYTMESRNKDTNDLLFTRTKKLYEIFDKKSMTRIDFLTGGVSTLILTFHKRGTLSSLGKIRLINKRGSIAEITFTITGKIYVRFSTK